MERPIESRVLLYVVTVAEDGNIARAAKTKLFIAPGSLARDIRNLEKRIGYPLFTRRWGGVALTPAGTVFVEETRKSLDHSQRAADRGAAASRRETGTLNVAKEFERQYSGFVPRWSFNQSSNRTQRRRKHT